MENSIIDFEQAKNLSDEEFMVRIIKELKERRKIDVPLYLTYELAKDNLKVNYLSDYGMSHFTEELYESLFKEKQEINNPYGDTYVTDFLPAVYQIEKIILEEQKHCGNETTKLLNSFSEIGYKISDKARKIYRKYKHATSSEEKNQRKVLKKLKDFKKALEETLKDALE